MWVSLSCGESLPGLSKEEQDRQSYGMYISWMSEVTEAVHQLELFKQVLTGRSAPGGIVCANRYT